MSNVKKSALGKGLGAILGDASNLEFSGKPAPKPERTALQPSASPDAGVLTTYVRLDCIEPNPYQPRDTFDNEALGELAASIRTIGLVQPITVRRVAPDKYQIISGERRFRAARLAGLESIPVFIHKANDQGMLEMAIIENIQRENLDAIETALSFQRLIDECNLTQEQMADRIGKKRATVTNFLRLLRLPVEIQSAVKQGTVSMGHAKVLLSVADRDVQMKLALQVINNHLSVRQLEEKVAKLERPAVAQRPSENALPESYYRLADAVGRYFNNNVTFRRSPKGNGTISISFDDDSQIEQFLKVLESQK